MGKNYLYTIIANLMSDEKNQNVHNRMQYPPSASICVNVPLTNAAGAGREFPFAPLPSTRHSARDIATRAGDTVAGPPLLAFFR